MVSKKLLGIAALAVVLVAGIVGGSYFFIVTSGGWTTLSLTQVDFKSSDPILNDKVWVLTVRAGGLAQYAQGTFDNTEIKESDGSYAKEDLTIKLTNTKQIARYPIAASGTAYSIYNYGYIKKSKFAFWVNLMDECKKYGEPVAGGPMAWSFDEVCVYRNKLASVGTLPATPNMEFRMDAEVKAGTNTYTGTITNMGERDVKFGNVAYATWLGALKGGDAAPDPSAQSLYPFYAQGWKLGDKNYYDAYKAEAQRTDLSSYWLGQCSTENCVSALISDLNTLASRAVQTKSLVSQGGTVASVSTSSETSGEAVLDLPDLIDYPIMTFYVKASTLGIVQPVAIPKLSNCNGATFKTGETGQAYGTIKNVGDGEGNMVVSAKCDGTSITQSGAAKEYYLEPQSQSSFFLNFASSVPNQQVSSKCVITASFLSTTSTCEVTMTAKPQEVCTSGQRTCVDNKIVECNTAGTGFTVQIQDCGKGVCTSEFGVGLYCKEEGVTPVPVPPTPPEPEWQRYLWIALAAALFGAVAYALSKRKEMAVVGAVIGGVLAFWWQSIGFFGQLAVGIGGAASAGIIIVLIVIGLIAFSFRGVVVGKK